MEKINLQEHLNDIFRNVINGKLDTEVIGFDDYKSKYVHLKPSVVVEARFTDGKTVRVDLSDWFKGVVK